MKTFITRSITGLIFGFVVISCLRYSVWTLGLFFLFTTALGLLEFNKLLKPIAGVRPQNIWTLFAGLLIYISIFLAAVGEIEVTSLVAFIPLLVLGAAINLFSSNRSFVNVSLSVAGVLYVAVPFALLTVMGMMSGEYSFHIPLGLMILIWAHDTGAYFVGSTLGKHPLMKKVSPKKSWEGFFGGLIFCFGAAYFIGKYYISLSSMDWMVLAAIVVVFGNLGDLTESAMKRNAGIKDSGNFMPGHGGVLDRFDSLIFSSPIALVYLQLFNS